LALVVATIAVYSPVHGHPFASLDDGAYFYSNPHVRAGVSWETVKWAFTSFGTATPDVPDWHPLAWLSHALDADMFAPGPAGPHDINLLLHALNVLLLFLVLQHATGMAARSAMVAGLFALHPINVETVAWIAERKNLLSMTFFLLALGAYGWYARRPGVGRYLAVFVLFALGLMAKPQVVTLPFVLLLWDYWPMRRVDFDRASPALAKRRLERGTQADDAGSSSRREFASAGWQWLVLEKLPLFALAAASCVVTVKSQEAVGGINQHIALAARLGNAVVSYLRYLAKALWPANLSPFYPHPGGSLAAWKIAGALVVLLGISAAVIVLRRRRYLPVGWFWFVGTLVPMIGLVQVNRQAMADRYGYISFIGLFLLICWGVSELAEQRNLSPIVLRVAGCAALAALGLLTYRQLGYWSDNLTLWSHALEVTEGNYLAENIVGSTLMDQGRGDDALPHFVAATEMNPADASAYMAIGTYDQQHGEPAEAITQYQKTIALTNDAVQKNLWLRSTTLARLGSAYRQLGRFEEARQSFRQALELNPNDGQVWLALGIVNAQGGDSRAAVEAYAQAVKLQPTDVGYLLLARALEQSGQTAQAQAATAAAQRISHDLPAAQQKVDAIFGGRAAANLGGR
jgi:tetratricopeptide (TPR) repeat protein